MSLLIGALAAAALAPMTSAPVTVDVTNVRNDHGMVRVAVCPRDKFLADACPYTASAPAHAGTTRVVVENVPPGDYAAQGFHDENGNDEIDRGLFGIPKEGVGFSRDARIAMSPPKWADAVFSHGGKAQAITFRLRYFMGPGSPQAWAREHR